MIKDVEEYGNLIKKELKAKYAERHGLLKPRI